MTKFSELSISAQLKSNLTKHSFIEPTPVQALSIEPALEGRNLVATIDLQKGGIAGYAPTGTWSDGIAYSTLERRP